MQISKKVYLHVFALFVAAYIAAYGVLSVLGSYSDNPYASGRYVNYLGMGIKDTRIWVPRFIKYDKYDNGNALGVLFRPLIIADRMVWHTPKMLFTPEEESLLVQQGAWFKNGQINGAAPIVVNPSPETPLSR